MRVYSFLIAACWIGFLGYWFIAAFGAKRNARSPWQAVLVRAIIAAVVILLIRSRVLNVGPGSNATISNPFVRMFGVLLCVAGIAYATWARRHIGKNWGMPMSVKERPELVSSGPYAYTRHPIYAGVIVALVGSALAMSLWWLVGSVVAFVYFLYAATREEKTMIAEFPREYREYQRRTKMLIPFLF
jgi:protein-S-isoprenylcysteine O-methyltransferase Ste14